MFEILLYNVVLARVNSIRAISLIIDSRARRLGIDPDLFEVRYEEAYVSTASVGDCAVGNSPAARVSGSRRATS